MIQEFYFAQKAFILREGKILLIKKSAADPNQANKWEVPGGRMKFGEEINDHIKREILEEVGLSVNPGDPFYIWQWQINRKNNDGEDLKMQIVAVARLCQYKSGEISFDLHAEDDYISDYSWVRFEDIKKYNVIENMYPVIDKFLEKYGPYSTQRI